MESRETGIGEPHRRFETTLWTLIIQAKDPSSPKRQEALNRLISIYWKPVYFFVRGKGHSVEDAKDLVQGFFTSLIEKDSLRSVTADKGKFRTFLMACMEHHLADARDRQEAQKRGGGRPVVSLDVAGAEKELPAEALSQSPLKVYERSWALTVLDLALRNLRQEYEESGKPELFEALKAFVLVGPDTKTAYADITRTLGLSEGAARVAVHRARKRYRELIRKEVRRTVLDPSVVDQELSALLDALR